MDAKYKFNLPDEIWIKDRLAELSSKATAAKKALDDYHKDKTDAAEFVDAGAEDALTAAAELSKAAYDNFRHVLRQTEAVRQQSAPVFEASLVTKASPPLRASAPRAGIRAGNVDDWRNASWHRSRNAARLIGSRHPHQWSGLEGASDRLHRSHPKGQVRCR